MPRSRQALPSWEEYLWIPQAECAKSVHSPEGISSGKRKVGSAITGENPGGSMRASPAGDHSILKKSSIFMNLIIHFLDAGLM
jgi:hypothetical protein